AAARPVGARRHLQRLLRRDRHHGARGRAARRSGRRAGRGRARREPHAPCRDPPPCRRPVSPPRRDGLAPRDRARADTRRHAGRGSRTGARAVSDPRALITGVTGQDGSYLAELLLEKGYEVYGMTRRASTENLERIAHLVDRIALIQGDLLDPPSLDAALRQAEPHE